MENPDMEQQEKGPWETTGAQVEVSPQAVELAGEALRLTRDALMMRYRYLDRALWKMRMVPGTLDSSCATDASLLCFDPDQVVASFTANPDLLSREMLHMVFHCVLYHPFVSPDASQGLWNLACDIAAEALCLSLTEGRVEVEGDAERRSAVETFQNALGNLSAEKLYLYLKSTNFDDGRLYYLSALFQRDDHCLWYVTPDPDMPDDLKDEADNAKKPKGSPDDGGEQEEFSDGPSQDFSPEPPQEGALAGMLAQQSEDAKEQAKKEWEHISKRMKVELENSLERYGAEAGSLVRWLAAANRKRYDYRSFLLRFAKMNEEMHLSPDEFDLIYYTYGMDAYGNIPLIEPLEYREDRKIRDFVVAVDTSGSVQGELVELFVEQTYSILDDAQSFFNQFNVHIIQCDAKVQSDVVVESRQQLDDYLSDMRIVGAGGTDFRPVFQHVEDLIREGAIQDLRGLVYFTDGHGTFPPTPPTFPAAFIIVDDGFGAVDVPVWAYKLVIDEFTLRGTAEAQDTDNQTARLREAVS